MRFVLGLDGGGSKTECVLMDESGMILARSRSGPSNPTNIGTEASVDSIAEASSLALRAASKTQGDIAYMVAGIAGAGEPTVRLALEEGLRPKFPLADIMVTSDLVLALNATGEWPAVVVVAGTGSAVLGRTAAPRFARAGGFGPVIGDPGSAYDIGRKAVAAATQKHLNDETFALGEEILSALGWKFNNLFDQVQRQSATVFPRIFPIVARAAEQGDHAALSLLTSAAEDLRKMARAVIEQLGLQEGDFFLGKTGGVFRGSAFLNDRFDGLIREIAPKARVGPLPHSVAETAARTAIEILRTKLQGEPSVPDV